MKKEGKMMAEKTERRRLMKEQRQLVFDKMGGHCAYCGCEISLQTMQVDHIVPLRKGGVDTLGNMWPACRSCNHYKHTLTVEQLRQEVEKAPNRLMRYDTTYRLAVRFGLLELNRKPVTFYFERTGAHGRGGSDIEKKLMEDQHSQLRSLKDKLADVLEHEPADAGTEEENEVWKQANLLFELLDGLFGGTA